jgi:hypothetical protein
MKVESQNNFLRILLSAFLMATFFIGVQAIFNAPSARADAICAGSGACLGTVAGNIVSGGGGGGNGSVFGPGGGGGGPAAVGSGGQVSAPAIPVVPQPAGGGAFGAYAYELRVTMVTGVAACPAKVINGFTVPSKGAILAERRDFVQWNTSANGYYPGYGGWYQVSLTCIYPPVSSNIITRTCIISYNASVDRMANSRLGWAGGVGSSSGTLGSVSALEANGAGGCRTNASVALDYNPPNGQNGWGQYQARSSIQQVTCQFTTTSFDGAINNIGKCGGVSSVPGSTGRMTIWCDGFVNYWVNKKWTGTDCQDGNNARLTCTIPTPAKFNGYTGNVQALRDGKDGTLLWGTPQVVGGWGMTNWKSSTVINAGSTPRNTAAGDNDKSQQLFNSSIAFNSNANGFVAGQNLDQKLAFYKAGDSGAPFSMTRNYRYDAWFTSVYTMVRSIDLRTGNIGIATSYENTFAVNNSCGPQNSPNIDVIRAIGDTVG